MVTHQLQVERTTAKAHRPKTNALPLDHATTRRSGGTCGAGRQLSLPLGVEAGDVERLAGLVALDDRRVAVSTNPRVVLRHDVRTTDHYACTRQPMNTFVRQQGRRQRDRYTQ